MVRATWGAAANEEEARKYLQTRLTLLFKLMFWSLVALLVLLVVMYGAYPTVEPRYNGYVYAIFTSGLSLMAFLWRGLLLRRTLSFPQLHAIDLTYSVGTGACIATCTILSYDRHFAGYTCLLYSCFTILTRALIVPSTGTRTAVVTILASLPMTVATFVLALATPQEVPPGGFIAGYLQLAVVLVLLSAAGSRIIYGLRSQVRAARRLGQYTLVKKIGEGAMGAVYLAHHVMLRRPTAVKLLRPDRVGADNLARFEREVQHTSQLTHPNTVAVYDYGRSPDGVFYYAMEYLGGGIDLENLVKEHGAQPAGRVVPILVQLCGALAEAHQRGIIHRDIKPANIILCQRGKVPDVVKLVDFGLVKQITADTGNSTQVILGTPAYLAPEAITDPTTIGPATDLYALGAVAYYLLTGRRVFEGKTAIALCVQHVNATPVPPSTFVPTPPALEAIVLRLLHKQPADRYASARVLGRALTALAMAPWDATGWWSDFRPRETMTTDAPPENIAVDLEHRSGVSA